MFNLNLKNNKYLIFLICFLLFKFNKAYSSNGCLDYIFTIENWQATNYKPVKCACNCSRDIINNKGYCKSCGHYGLIDRNSSQKIIT